METNFRLFQHPPSHVQVFPHKTQRIPQQTSASTHHPLALRKPNHLLDLPSPISGEGISWMFAVGLSTIEGGLCSGSRVRGGRILIEKKSRKNLREGRRSISSETRSIAVGYVEPNGMQMDVVEEQRYFVFDARGQP
jgi:hypothetical protein